MQHQALTGILTEQKLISDYRYRVIESSSLVPVLFREVFSHPYISLFHLLVNGFSVIYIYVCLWEKNTKKSYAKMRGRNYAVQTRACSKISFGSLKQSADYNFRLEFLILPSSGQLKPTCDTRIVHFYYTLEQLQHGQKYPFTQK